jgi:hypothetical protein
MRHERKFGEVAAQKPKLAPKADACLIASRPYGPNSADILSHWAPSARTRLINGVLGGRSFSSDKTNQREAPSSCAGTSAQAVKNDAHQSPSIDERSGSHLSPVTAFLIDTLPIRIDAKAFACSIGARSNRHSPATLTRISGFAKSLKTNEAKIANRPHFCGGSYAALPSNHGNPSGKNHAR